MDLCTKEGRGGKGQVGIHRSNQYIVKRRATILFFGSLACPSLAVFPLGCLLLFGLALLFLRFMVDQDSHLQVGLFPFGVQHACR